MMDLHSDPVSTLLVNKNKFSLLTIATRILTAIMTGISLAGLFIPAILYPTQALRESFQTNDLVNLVIGIPILLIPLWLTRRGHLVGLLFWLGALMYVFYNTIAYLVALPLNLFYALYAILLLGSLYIFSYLVTQIDSDPIQQRLSGRVHERLAGGFLIGFGAAFLIRAMSMLYGPVIHGATLLKTDLSVLMADIVLSIAWVISGVLLWKRKALGYIIGGAMLFQGVTLFLGLVLFLIVNPLLTLALFDLGAVLSIVLMSVICCIPFGLFVRGAVSTMSS